MDDIATIQEKLRQNSSHRSEMLALISSGEAIAFVGAGLSVPLKYPSWPSLLAKLDAQAAGLAPFNPGDDVKRSALKYAQAIKDHHQEHNGLDRYLNLLGREFALRTEGENCTETHRRLARLPFRAFVTTNYERCIESGLQYVAAPKPCPDPGIVIKAEEVDRHQVSLFLRSISESKGQRYVAHLHGRHDQTKSIILTANDYAEAYGLAAADSSGAKTPVVTLHLQLAWALFATRRMVFIGCSMDDPYVKELLDIVARNLWEAGERIHFVILPLDAKSISSTDSVAADFARFGLQVVYFNNHNGKFTALDQLLEEASAGSGIQVSAATPLAPVQPGIAAQSQSEPTPPPTVTVDRAWLEERNEDLTRKQSSA